MGTYKDFDLDLKQVKSENAINPKSITGNWVCNVSFELTNLSLEYCSKGCTVGACATPTQGGVLSCNSMKKNVGTIQPNC